MKARVRERFLGLFGVFFAGFVVFSRVSRVLPDGCDLFVSMTSWVRLRNFSKFSPISLLWACVDGFPQLHFSRGGVGNLPGDFGKCLFVS